MVLNDISGDDKGCASHSDFPLSEKLPEGWLWLRIDPETWGLINCFDKEKTPEKIVKEALYIVASGGERGVKELFRKEIAKWKDEDPLFMAYVYGQEAERKKILDEYQSDNIDEWCKLHEEVLKDIRTEAYRSGYHDGEIVGERSERDMLKRKYNQSHK